MAPTPCGDRETETLGNSTLGISSGIPGPAEAKSKLLFCFCPLVRRASCLPGLGAAEQHIRSVVKHVQQLAFRNGTSSELTFFYLINITLLLLIMRNILAIIRGVFLWVQHTKKKMYREVATASQCLEISCQKALAPEKCGMDRQQLSSSASCCRNTPTLSSSNRSPTGCSHQNVVTN